MVTGKANYDSIRLLHSICKEFENRYIGEDQSTKEMFIGERRLEWGMNNKQRSERGAEKEDITKFNMQKPWGSEDSGPARKERGMFLRAARHKIGQAENSFCLRNHADFLKFIFEDVRICSEEY